MIILFYDDLDIIEKWKFLYFIRYQWKMRSYQKYLLTNNPKCFSDLWIKIAVSKYLETETNIYREISQFHIIHL